MRILPQRAHQLAKAHVHRVHQRRPGFDQAVGKAARGRARVDAYAARHVNAKVADRAAELEPALGHKGHVQPAHMQLAVDGQHFGCAGDSAAAAVHLPGHQAGARLLFIGDQPALQNQVKRA